MQVVSGPIGLETVHFEAPPARHIEDEIDRFLKFFNAESSGVLSVDPMIKSGLAHLWFVTIHPFKDGNGRIGRAIMEMALARSENCAFRFYSFSNQIEKECSAYYEVLKRAQSGSL